MFDWELKQAFRGDYERLGCIVNRIGVTETFKLLALVAKDRGSETEFIDNAADTAADNA